MNILVKGVQVVRDYARLKVMFNKCNFSHAECFIHSFSVRRIVSNINISCILYL
jgi:hypothetical protein